jgi:predicted membrane channel-forming protein YqfA (hemolysin III family)
MMVTMRVGAFIIYFVAVTVVVAVLGVVVGIILDHFPRPLTILELVLVGVIAIPVIDGLRNRF